MTRARTVELIARTIRGIEWVAAAEISALGDADVFASEQRVVRFGVREVRPALLQLGTVDDLFVVVGELAGLDNTRASLSVAAAETARVEVSEALPVLARVRSLPEELSFDVVAPLVGRRNFNRFELEDAVGTTVAKQTGWRFETRSGERRPPPTPLSIRVHLRGDTATLGMRLGEHPLHRRLYRTRSRTGSLHPPVARALALVAGLREGLEVIDPFCGAGTIPIEAGLAVEGLSCRGFDLESEVLALARRNAGAANVAVTFAVADAASLPLADGTVDRVVTNPPWGRAVSADLIRPRTWSEIGRVLSADGRAVLLAPPALVDEAAAALALDPPLRIHVSLFGQHVELAILSRDGERFAATGALAALLPGAFAAFAEDGA